MLVVEDELLVRLAIADSLRTAGYVVVEAANADEAMVLLRSFGEIALLFTDVQMPGSMDGVELARFVRENYPHVAVIIASGAVTPPAADGEIPFIAKPYDPDAVVQQVKSILDEDQ